MAEFQWSASHYPYGSRRTVVYGRRGMVAASHPLAAQAGLQVMQGGGNAIDAAVAAAAALTVVEPTSNGIGSDLFAIVWSNNMLYGLNSSGPAPRALTIESLVAKGFDIVPNYGWGSVTVPGTPAGWIALTRRFGRLPLKEALAPAVRLAHEGHPIVPSVAEGWEHTLERFRKVLRGQEFEEWYRTFAPRGRAPGAGEIWQMPFHAQTLEEIGETEAQSFYTGRLAEDIVRYSRDTGGFMAQADLAEFSPEWVNPLSVRFRGFDVWELPPNGQGLIALIALGILEGLRYTAEEERIHYEIEALKLSFADGFAALADPRWMPHPPDAYLTADYLDERRALIGGQARIPGPGRPAAGGTVYLAAADGEGNMISLIQSNYRGFGSGLVVPGTGIALQNRGALFSLDPSHPNRLEGGKRPFNTIIPGFVTKNGKPVGPFGVMGGFMQPQGHVQVISRAFAENLNPQAALDAPRFYWKEGRRVAVEPAMPADIVESLRKRGHDVEVDPQLTLFGRGQIIWRDDQGVLQGGTEPRVEGQVAAW